jgi:hypothetical protein
MLLAFFIIGLYYAAYVDAGKGAGLAGGAIVVGYGIMFGGIAFIASFFIAHFLEISKIKIINWVLLALILGTWGYKFYQFQQRDTLQEKENIPYQNKNTTPTPTTEPVSANLVMKLENNASSNKLGLGFFKPNFFEHPTLYFYGNITLGKAVNQHTPQDSLALGRDQFGDFKPVSAPPWLWPEAMNQQFGHLYFKVIAVGRDFITVEGNSKTAQKTILAKRQGQLLYWPEFLLSTSSIQFLEGKEQAPKIKPLDNASKINTSFVYMTTLQIEGDWALVLLKDKKNQDVDQGWIRWKKDGLLLINYTIPNIET